MEDAPKEQSSASGTTPNAGRSSSKLRYPLRSATKPKEEKDSGAGLSKSSVSKGGRATSSVSKSVGVLDLSGKDKSAKPPRRLSIPAKSANDRGSKSVGNITPISEARTKRSTISQGKNDTPGSDLSRSSNRRKFNVLSSASYWLSQIKLSESAAKHSISLGFFKLALEAQCEPLQKVRDELNSYARRHNLLDIGESVRDVFESYDILENFEQLQVSETYSQVPDEGTRSSDDDVHSSSSITGTRKLEPKSLNTNAVQASPVTEVVKEPAQKTTPGTTRTRSLSKSFANSRSVAETTGHNIQKKIQKSTKPEANKEKKGKTNKLGKKASIEEGLDNPSPAEVVVEGNKENMDAPQIEEISVTEV